MTAHIALAVLAWLAVAVVVVFVATGATLLIGALFASRITPVGEPLDIGGDDRETPVLVYYCGDSPVTKRALATQLADEADRDEARHAYRPGAA